MTSAGSSAVRSVRSAARVPRRLAGRVRGRWRDGLVAGRRQPRWWPERLMSWPGMRGPHADKEVVLFAAGRRYEFTPAVLRRFSGHVHHGTLRPTTQEVADSLARLGLGTDAARTLATVSRFEGGYDAIQTYDSARFSWGFIQFSAPGGLFHVLAEIKATQPELFASIFSPAGIDVEGWQVTVHRDGRTLVGPRAHDLLHDDPTLWTPFIAAAAIPAVQDAQVKVAHEHYFTRSMQATARADGRDVAFGELFAESEVGRTLLVDRAVRRGPASAIALFGDAMRRCGVHADPVIDEVRRIEAHDTVRLTSIVETISGTDAEGV